MPETWLQPETDAEAALYEGFGLDHLPFGAFRTRRRTYLAVRLGAWAVDLAACAALGLLDPCGDALANAATAENLNPLLELGPGAWATLRARLTDLLTHPAEGLRRRRDRCLHPLDSLDLAWPAATRGYTDFYASPHHARRVGELFRPDQPLLPNYRWLPIGYNGRASSLVLSGTPVRRPQGQRRPADLTTPPPFGPTQALDFELELAFVVGPGNPLGQPIAMAEARHHLFGITLLNDWSARDVQSWEYQPLGPFLGKSFATTLSPWITPLAALESAQTAAPASGPEHPTTVLPHLSDPADQASGALALDLEVLLSTQRSRAADLPPFPLTQTSTNHLAWTAAQLVAHHTSNGCPLEPGDLLATGTVSGPHATTESGCLLERTANGARPLTLPNGETRAWLHDGDHIQLRGRAGSVHLAPAEATILPPL